MSEEDGTTLLLLPNNRATAAEAGEEDEDNENGNRGERGRRRTAAAGKPDIADAALNPIYRH